MKLKSRQTTEPSPSLHTSRSFHERDLSFGAFWLVLACIGELLQCHQDTAPSSSGQSDGFNGTDCPEKLWMPHYLEAFRAELDGIPGDLVVGNPTCGRRGLELNYLKGPLQTKLFYAMIQQKPGEGCCAPSGPVL